MGQGYGYLQPSDTKGGYNPTAFIVRQILGRVRTLMIAQVKAVGAGTVDVMPLVSMVDSQGNAVNHGIIHGCPYLEMRAGSSAIVAVPVVEDVGLIGVCDRDSSAATTSRVSGPPPSAREFDFSDAIYLMSISGGQNPTTVIGIGPDGISLVDGFGNTINMGSGGITITGSTVIINGINFSTHEHSGVTTGSDPTGPPI
jgi:hypothetical protein